MSKHNSIFPFLDFGTYDFIVVGSGSSGSVVSSRLSEISKWKILLLEAGGEENDFTDIPSLNKYVLVSESNWGYNTTVQKFGCKGVQGNRCPYPRGKILGGTSTVNELIYSRGLKQDFDKWAELSNSEWSYEEVLPYFKKMENFQILPLDEKYHGHTGPLYVNYSTPQSDFADIFINGCKSLGLKSADYTGKDDVGVSRLQTNTKNGKRVDGGSAYIRAARSRPNFDVITDALVTKLVYGDDKTVFGVVFMKDGKQYQVSANKEVILSAGVINTPQILLLSGIGPKEELQKHDIELVVDLPVGQNMRDHNTHTLQFKTNLTAPSSNFNQQIREYIMGTGLLTSPSNLKAISVLKLDETEVVPGNEYVFIAPTAPTGKPVISYISYKDDIKEALKNDANPLQVFTLVVNFFHPESVGEVTLKSNDYLDFPVIESNIFKNSTDIEKMYQAIQFGINLSKTPPFQKINATILAPKLKECEDFELLSKDYWYCAITHLTMVSYHGTGTTRMGNGSRSSVVDAKLKVHGIKNLRIADCGIIPVSMSGHTSAPAFMVGEKLAEMIKAEYNEI